MLGKHYLWNPDYARPAAPVPMRQTLHDMFWERIATYGDAVLMRQKDFGIWREWSWRAVGACVREIAHGLLALGFDVGERVSVLSNTRVEWVWCDLAVLSVGGVGNGIYPTDAASQVEYLCKDSASVMLVVEDDEQLDKALAVRDKLPLLRWIVVIDPDNLAQLDDPMVITLEELQRRGAVHAASNADALERRRASRSADDLAILVYTSGTTGPPKGAMLSHRNILTVLASLSSWMPQDVHDERICFQPLCHVGERINGFYAGIYAGVRLNFVENPDTVADNVREIAPTVFSGVPRIWEKFYSSVIITVKEAGPIQQRLYTWAIRVGHAIVDRVLAGQSVSTWLRWQYHIANIAALNNVRRFIGIHRCRMMMTGAAPIAPDLIRWYLALGIPMLECWGQTESSGVATSNLPVDIRLGTIGPACKHNEVRIDPATGEILVRGENVFMGYLNLPEKTREAIDVDGWLHTGDVGTVDEQGFFRIIDRMKDIIITAGGKNISPSEWENELKFSLYVTDAIVIGDRRPYLTAIIMIDQENVERYAQDHDVAFSNYLSLTRAPEIRALIEAEVAKVNTKFARVEQIKKFYLLETQLDAEDEELTPTMKLKRKLVQRKYATQIEEMYV